jgi:hypothetical protein
MKNRKNKFSNFLKLGIIFLSLLLLFSNCKNDEGNTYENLESPTVVEKLSFLDLKNENSLKTPMKALDNFFDLNQKGFYKKGNSPELVMKTDEITKISKGKNNSYTFKVESNYKGYFHNFIIQEKDNDINFHLITYKKNEEHNHYPHTINKIQKLNYDFFLNNTNLFKKDGVNLLTPADEGSGGGSSDCVSYYYAPCEPAGGTSFHYPSCQHSGAPHVNNDCNYLCTGSIYTIDVSACYNNAEYTPSDTGDDTNNQDGSLTNGGGNNNDSDSGGSPILSIPTYNGDISIVKNLLISNLNITDLNTIDWINNDENNTAFFSIYLIMTESNWSLEANSFAKQAIALEITLAKELKVTQTGEIPSELITCCPGYGDYENDKIIKEYGIQPVQTAVDGTFNLIVSFVSSNASAEWVGTRVRRIMTEIGMSVPNDVTNEHLAAIFKIRKRNGIVIVEYKEGILKEMLDLGLNSLDMIAFLTPSKGGGAFLATKIGGISITKMTQYFRKIAVNNKKVDDIVNTLNPKAKFDLNGTGPNTIVKGHHPLAKIAFKSDKFYDLEKAFSVSPSKLQEVWIKANPTKEIIINVHNKITGKQISGYKSFAKKMKS